MDFVQQYWVIKKKQQEKVDSVFSAVARILQPSLGPESQLPFTETMGDPELHLLDYLVSCCRI